MKSFADMNNDNYYLIMPASGIGKRMKSQIPKQYLKLENDLTIIDQCLKTLLEVDIISGFVISLSEDDTLFKSSIYFNHSKMLANVEGGKERLHSVLNSLNSLNKVDKSFTYEIARVLRIPSNSLLLKIVKGSSKLTFINLT